MAIGYLNGGILSKQLWVSIHFFTFLFRLVAYFTLSLRGSRKDIESNGCIRKSLTVAGIIRPGAL